MSLVNVWLQSGRVVAAADTRCRHQHTGEFFDASKLLPLPHANTVLAARGQNVYLFSAFSLVAQVVRGSDFDAVEAVMGQVLQDVTRFVESNIQALSPADARALDAQELVIAGWSQRRGARAILYKQDSPEAGFVATEIQEPGWVSPWTADWGDAPAPGGIDALVSLARDQVRRTRELLPSAPIGGRLLLADITAGGVSLSSQSIDVTRSLQDLHICQRP